MRVATRRAILKWRMMTDTPKNDGGNGAPDYSRSLFLPKTDFPMRAGLPKKEPEILARWQEIDLYGKLRAQGQGQAEIRPA